MKCNYKNRDMRNKVVTVECSCGKAFKPDEIKLNTHRTEADIEETYYHCPHCSKKYTVIKTNTEIRELMAQRDALKGYVFSGNAEEFQKLDEEIKKKLNILNGK